MIATGPRAGHSPKTYVVELALLAAVAVLALGFAVHYRPQFSPPKTPRTPIRAAVFAWTRASAGREPPARLVWGINDKLPMQAELLIAFDLPKTAVHRDWKIFISSTKHLKVTPSKPRSARGTASWGISRDPTNPTSKSASTYLTVISGWARGPDRDYAKGYGTHQGDYLGSTARFVSLVHPGAVVLRVSWQGASDIARRSSFLAAQPPGLFRSVRSEQQFYTQCCAGQLPADYSAPSIHQPQLAALYGADLDNYRLISHNHLVVKPSLWLWKGTQNSAMGESDLEQATLSKNPFWSSILLGIVGGALIAIAQTVGNLLRASRERQHAQPAAGQPPPG